MVFGIGTTVAQEQKNIHSGEAFQMWQHLVMRYDIIELADIFQNFANDAEFKAILSSGLNKLKDEISKIEDEMNRLGIPLPPRPPKSINTPANTEILRDELMYRTLYVGVQNFLNEHQRTIVVMKNERLRDMFLAMYQTEISIYTKLGQYGKLKGWIPIPPAYKGGN